MRVEEEEEEEEEVVVCALFQALQPSLSVQVA